MNFFLAVFISFCDLEKDSLASFDVKIAAAWLVVHCGAYSSACSGSEIEVEWSGAVVAVFDNAVFGWDWLFHWYIIISRCESDQKSQHWNDFHVFYGVLILMEEDLEDLILWIFLIALYSSNEAQLWRKRAQNRIDIMMLTILSKLKWR